MLTGVGVGSGRRSRSDVAATARATTAPPHASHSRRLTPEVGPNTAAPGVDACCRTQRSSRRRSCADCHRSTGSFARQSCTTWSSAGGVEGAAAESAGGTVSRIFATRLADVVASNGLRPLTISYTMQPNAQWSERASASLPWSCSGLMYCTVPTMLPREVSGDSCVIEAVASATETATGCSFASPKSSSFTPAAVSMMLPGFKSRWTMPCWCMASSASAIWMATFSASVERSAPRASRCRERLAFEILHHQEDSAILPADVVQGADVRMVEGARWCGLRARIADGDSGESREMRRQYLDRHRAIQACVARAVDLAHAPGADRAENLVGPEPRPGLQGHGCRYRARRLYAHERVGRPRRIATLVGGIDES